VSSSTTDTPVPRYQRVLVKLSGRAVAGESEIGFDSDALRRLATEVLSLTDLGIEVAVVIGGGNVFRGNVAEDWGIDRVEADNIGMLGTVVNSLLLRGMFNALTERDIRVMTALPMEAIAEPYIRLRAVHHLEKGALLILACGIGQPFLTTDYPAVQRALEVGADAILVGKHGVDGVYDADPNVDPSATRFTRIDYDETITRGLQVMDQSAFMLARDYNLPIHVFDVDSTGSMRAIALGEDRGTIITRVDEPSTTP
jgi:uridylate kinase